MPEEIQTIAESFIRVFSLVLVPTYSMIITGGVLRSSGRIHIAMINSFVAASVNVVGELILSFGWGPIPAMGYIGIAWGTAIATTLGMALNLICVFSGPARVTLRSLTNPIFGCIKNLVRLGVPTALQQTAWNVGTLMVYFLVGRLQGGEITALAAMTVWRAYRGDHLSSHFRPEHGICCADGKQARSGRCRRREIRCQGDCPALPCNHILAGSRNIHSRSSYLRLVDSRSRGAAGDDSLSRA